MATRNTEAGGATGGTGGAGRSGGGGQDGPGGGKTRARGGVAGRGTSAGGKSADAGASGGGKTAAGKGGSKAGASGAKKSGGSRGGAKAANPGAKSGGRATASGGAGGNQKLRSDLREFVQAHPGGWGHNEWIGLVNLLRDRGHDTGDTDAIGMALERERLTLVLERVPGLGAQRVKAIADKYPRIWNVMQAGAEELAMAANLPKAVAKKVKDALP